MSILQMRIPMPLQSFSSSKVLSSSAQTNLFLTNQLSLLSLTSTAANNIPFKSTTIRMGGGPRTYPGGVSKWQWKRMQAKKAKQLLRARLARERQIYEMRKRAELKAAVSELERPWEVVEKAPTLFSVGADEQLKVLADRFQKAGGFDMWSEQDGPQLFHTVDGLPSARFFPKGVVHSIKPYAKVEDSVDSDGELRNLGSNYERERGAKMKVQRFGRNNDFKKSKIGPSTDGQFGDSQRNSRLEMKVQRFGSTNNLRKSKIGLSAEGKVGESENESELKMKVRRFGSSKNLRKSEIGSSTEEEVWNVNFRRSKEVLDDGENGKSSRAKFRNRNGRKVGGMNAKSRQVRFNRGQNERNMIGIAHASDGEFIGCDNLKHYRYSNSQVYDMSLQEDGSYEFGAEKERT